MKTATRHLKRIAIGGGIAIFAVLLASCGMIGTTAGANMTVTVHTSDGGPAHFTLADKNIVPDISSNDWEIGFSYDRQIFTDSGSSVRGGNGGGGVYFTGQTNYDAVQTVDPSQFVDDSAHRSIDHVYSVVADGFFASARTLNVIDFIGYGKGDGSSDHPYDNYQYSANQFYVGHGLTIGSPSYTMTNNVYIIRHGDGVHYSKLQILGMEYDTSKRVYSIKTDPLN